MTRDDVTRTPVLVRRQSPRRHVARQVVDLVPAQARSMSATSDVSLHVVDLVLVGHFALADPHSVSSAV
jgi:hypothetical protein